MTVKTKEGLSEKQSADFFWKLLDLNAFPIIIWELDGRIDQANNAFLKLLGYSRRELEEGKINWKEMTPSEFRYLDERCVEQLRTKETADPFEKKYKRKDGTLVKVRLYNVKLERGDNFGVGVIIPLEGGKK